MSASRQQCGLKNDPVTKKLRYCQSLVLHGALELQTTTARPVQQIYGSEADLSNGSIRLLINDAQQLSRSNNESGDPGSTLGAVSRR